MCGNRDGKPCDTRTNIRFYIHKENTRWYINKIGLYNIF